MTLAKLQDYFLVALTQAEHAEDDDERNYWQAVATQFSNLVAARMTRAEPLDPEMHGWRLTNEGGRYIAGSTEVHYGQQVIHMGHGYFGTGRRTLRLGEDPMLISHEPSLLKAALVAYLHRQNLPIDAQESIVNKFFPDV